MLIILMTKVDYGFFYRIFNGFFHQFFKSANFSSASLEKLRGFSFEGS